MIGNSPDGKAKKACVLINTDRKITTLILYERLPLILYIESLTKKHIKMLAFIVTFNTLISTVME